MADQRKLAAGVAYLVVGCCGLQAQSLIVCGPAQGRLHLLESKPFRLTLLLTPVLLLRVGLAPAVVIVLLLTALFRLALPIPFIFMLPLGQLTACLHPSVPLIVQGLSPFVQDQFAPGRLTAR